MKLRRDPSAPLPRAGHKGRAPMRGEQEARRVTASPHAFLASGQGAQRARGAVCTHECHRSFSVTARERQHDRDDPEADHDLRLGPAELLEMMMERRHAEHALAGELERHAPARSPTPLRARTARRRSPARSRAWSRPRSVPSMPPSASEPVSPMKIEAGGALNQRKPEPAPITAPHSTASSPVPGT